MGDIYRHDINLTENQSITMFSKRSTPYNKAELARLLYMQGYRDQTTGLRVNTSSGSVVLYDSTGQNTDGAMTQKATTDAITTALATAKAQWLLDMNPIGTIIENNTGTNPSTYIGGTWELYGEGMVTVCIDEDDMFKDFNTVGKTGGSRWMQNHTHTATFTGTKETGWFSGYQLGQGAGTADGTIFTSVKGTQKGCAKEYGTSPKFNFSLTPKGTIDVIYEGDGNSQNLQPYIVVYRWIRTA